MRERFKNSLILDILPIIFIIVFGEISILQWRTGVVPSILAGVVVSGAIAFMRGETLRNIEDAMGLISVYKKKSDNKDTISEPLGRSGGKSDCAFCTLL